MTDTPSLPPSSLPPSSLPPSEPADRSGAAPPPPARKRDAVPWLYGLGLLVLAGAVFYLWQNPGQPSVPPGPSPETLALQDQVRTLNDRIAKLEQRPVADIGPLANRIAALEQRPSIDASVPARIDAMSGRIEALSGRQQTGDSELAQRIDAQDRRLSNLQGAAGQVSAVKDRAERLARIQAASAALAAGQKLGAIPDAPPALARYATTDPPTEARLRLSYPKAERAAIAASVPDTEDKPFLARVLARTEELVTIRQGDHVIVGGTAAGILARAHAALDAGDLGAAVAAVSELTGPPAKAMEPWLSDAKALQAARDALASMAERA